LRTVDPTTDLSATCAIVSSRRYQVLESVGPARRKSVSNRLGFAVGMKQNHHILGIFDEFHST
ncbi:hypothetical protein, partial [Shinella sp.]|uniref:hypothetical protein n=1 Tax=Shinella sp. TaxID=1870904 RepID=UPI003F720F43